MRWSAEFYQWFLRELLASLEGVDRPNPLRIEEQVAPRLRGQVTRDARGVIDATGRQSNLFARPGQPVVTTSDALGRVALGDGPRGRPNLWHPRGGLFIPARYFSDLLLPAGLPSVGSARVFRRYPNPPLPSFAPPGSNPVEWAPAPSWPMIATPTGPWVQPFPAPPTFAGGLTSAPLLAYFNSAQVPHYLYPRVATLSDLEYGFGLYPLQSDAFPGAEWFGANTDNYYFSLTEGAPRPNILLPYAAGVDATGLYVRVPATVAAINESNFTYLNTEADVWVFNPFDELTMKLLYDGTEWGPLGSNVQREEGFPYVDDLAVPTGLISPANYEDIFQEFPIITDGWVYQGDDGSGNPIYLLDHWAANPAFTAGRLLGVYKSWSDRVAIGQAAVEDGTAAFFYQPPITGRAFGPIIDSVGNLTRTIENRGTRKVRADGSHTAGPGTVRIERFTVAAPVDPEDPEAVPVFFETTHRRVIDRIVLCWHIYSVDLAGPVPADPASVEYGNEWDEAVDTAGFGAVMAYTEHLIDWGVCWQEYRVVLSRFDEKYPQGSLGYRGREIHLYLERRNKGGDFIAERGLSNWGGLNADTVHRTHFRWRLPGDIEDVGYGPKWWEDYTVAEVSQYLGWVDSIPSYFKFLPRTSLFSGLIDRGGTQFAQAGIEYHDPDIYPENTANLRLVQPITGRFIKAHYPEGDPVGPGYPNPPVFSNGSAAIASDDMRADIWYPVLSVPLGLRFATEPDYTGTDIDEVTEVAGGEVQVVVDDSGVPIYDFYASFADKVDTLPYPDVNGLVQRFVAGANLYEGDLGTLPCPLAAASRVETFCGLSIDAADQFAVDVVTNPDGTMACLAVAADWTYRLSLSVDGVWSQVGSGAFADLLTGADVLSVDAEGVRTTVLDDAYPPIQEYRFAMSDWPTPVGSVRGPRQGFAFRYPIGKDAAAGDDRPVIVRLAGGYRQEAP